MFSVAATKATSRRSHGVTGSWNGAASMVTALGRLDRAPSTSRKSIRESIDPAEYHTRPGPRPLLSPVPAMMSAGASWRSPAASGPAASGPAVPGAGSTDSLASAGSVVSVCGSFPDDKENTGPGKGRWTLPGGPPVDMALAVANSVAKTLHRGESRPGIAPGPDRQCQGSGFVTEAVCPAGDYAAVDPACAVLRAALDAAVTREGVCCGSSLFQRFCAGAEWELPFVAGTGLCVPEGARGAEVEVYAACVSLAAKYLSVAAHPRLTRYLIERVSDAEIPETPLHSSQLLQIEWTVLRVLGFSLFPAV